MHNAKQAIRKSIAVLKKSYTPSALDDRSRIILNQLEENVLFQQASCVALYHALPGEVQTAEFIEKWAQHKTILLPVVEGDNLRLLPYNGRQSLKEGAFGILEPNGLTDGVSEKDINLIVIPGIAFDRHLNRLGRGKGFYDRLLTNLDIPKIAICFHFQLIEQVPTEPFDRPMDYIITEEETIGGK